ADLITGDVRSILQARFGSAGHGFILPGKPWAWYQHSGAHLDGKGWQFHAASQFKSLDGAFGLGGVSFTGTSAVSRIRFDQPQSRFELWFERQPGGGTVTLSVDDSELGSVDTDGEKAPGFAVFESQPAVHSLELHTAGGPVRIFGVTAESSGPGVVYDSL